MTESMVSEVQKTALEEPWLRGTHAELPAVIRAVLHSMDMAREDIHKWCGPLTEEEINACPHDLPPIAFHMRHISRSMDRLLCFADGEQLRPEHYAALKREMDPGANREDVFDEFARCIHATKLRVAAYESADLEEARSVGRKQLPSSIGGLLLHVAEHTQRHVGQAVTTAKVLLAIRNERAARLGVRGME